MTRVGFLHSVMRKEERLLLDAFKENGVDPVLMDVRAEFELGGGTWGDIDVALERSISFSQGLNASRMLEAHGVKVINPSEVIATCGDKIATSSRLYRYKVPQPRTGIAQSLDSAVSLIERWGYPVVIKPAVGSWGRQLAKVNDRDAAEAVAEQRLSRGYPHTSVYIQEYVDKGGFDIRSFVVGGRCIAAIRRESNHWITNTARGGKAHNCVVTDNLAELSARAAEAISPSMEAILAVDLMEKDGELVVIEVNATMEFKNSISTTGVNIPEVIVNHVLEVARR